MITQYEPEEPEIRTKKKDQMLANETKKDSSKDQVKVDQRKPLGRG